MEDSNLSADVEMDNSTLQSGVQTMMDFEDRQLSSDFDTQCHIQTSEDGNGTQPSMTGRGPVSQEEIKREFPSSCMYTGHASAGYRAFGQVSSSGHSLPSFQTFTSGISSSSPFIRPESQDTCWNPAFPGSLASDTSLSADDLSMDRAPSIPFSQIQSTQGMASEEHSFLGGGSFRKEESIPRPGGLKRADRTEPMRYPHEDKLRRYNGECSIGETNEHHQQWQHVVQQSQQQQQHQQHVEIPVQTMDDDAKEEYVFEVDEFGEGPLHVLTAVTDKKVLAKALDMLVCCGVVAKCINLQNKQKQTPLFLAVQNNNFGFVSWLLENGADPNIQGTLYVDRDEYIWRAPIHLAAMYGDGWLMTLRLLFTKSTLTDINLFSYGDKLTALHLALKHHTPTHSHKAVTMELIDRHADISLRDQSSSKTPFMMVLDTRDLNLIPEFLNKFSAERKRAILQEQLRSGDTCLHIAAGLSHIDSGDKARLLRYLVTNGANGNIMNNVKEYPKDFARKEWESIRRT